MKSQLVTIRIFQIALLLAALLLGPGIVLRAQSVAASAAVAEATYQVKFDHPNLIVAHVRAEAEWYMRLLGFQLPEGSKLPEAGAKSGRVRLTLPGVQLFLVQYEGAQPARPAPDPREQLGVAYLAFEVSDLVAALNAVKAEGLLTQPTHNPQGQVVGFLFRDPEGNQIEFFSRKP